MTNSELTNLYQMLNHQPFEGAHQWFPVCGMVDRVELWVEPLSIEKADSQMACDQD